MNNGYIDKERAEQAARRVNWLQRYTARLEAQPPELPLRCPCCGCKTLGERGGFEICGVCCWEDDGQDDYDADVVRGGPNTTAPLVNTYVAGPIRPGDVCDDIPWRYGFAPAATPTSAGSLPHPTAACRPDARAVPVPRARSSAALVSPNRRRSRARNHRASSDSTVWWCQPTQPRVSYSSSPHSPLAASKLCSTDQWPPRTWASFSSGTSAAALERWYFTSACCPSDRRTS